MRKRLVFLMLLCMMFSGCGGSAAPQDRAEPADDYVAEQTGAPGAAMDEETAASWNSPMGAGLNDGLEAQEDEPAEAMTGSNYFSFVRDNTVTTAEDGTELLYEYSCETTFTSWDPETQAWVDGILAQIQKDYASNSKNLLNYAQDSLNGGDSAYFYSFSNYQEVGAARHDSRIVSLMVLSSVYSGGAHPNSLQTAWNLDLEQKRLLKLEDVLYPGTGSILGAMVKERVEEKFLPLGEGALFADYANSIEAAFSGENMTPYWYFNDQGMVIFFNQYALGPYAAGIIKTEISYRELDGILMEEYLPGHYSMIPGDMLLRSGWEGYQMIPITVESDGDRIMIGVEGEVWQVQLSEIFWLEGTAIGQKMLFSADRLTEHDVLELIGGYDDETRSFAVEFFDDQGNVTVYYIHPDGLRTEP